MITLSLCMIVKNEEKTLERCLDSVKNLVDEIIIVDTGSTDLTKELAKRYTKQIFEFTWIDDFSAARNFAFQHANMDYILTMDADDVFREDDLQKLQQLKRTLAPSVDAISMKYLAGFDESGNVLVSLRQIRIVKREKQFKWQGAVHEVLEVAGNIVHSDIAVTHDRVHQNSDRNLKIYEKRLRAGNPFSERDLFYYANELYDHQRYKQAISFYQKFLQSQNVWIEDKIQAYGKIADCYAALGNIERAICSTLQSFQYGPPRAESCCRLGFLFLQQKRPDTAVYLFQIAAQLPVIDYGGIIHHACFTWIPHLQLGVCYAQLGDCRKAYEHNEIARSLCPENNLILHNKALLEKQMKR